MTGTELSEFDVRIPGTPICDAARELAQDVSPAFLYNHVMRTFAFGHTVGRSKAAEYDTEMLFLGAILHDLGLVEKFIGEERFEVDGADAAAHFLLERGYPDTKIAVIWDAIALHTTLSVPQRKRPEIALVQLGAGIDVGAVPLAVVTPGVVDQILDAFPRIGFKQAMIDALAEIVARKPMTGLTTLMGDVGRECVDGFNIPSICDVIRSAPFED